jgi:hypothetical protein
VIAGASTNVPLRDVRRFVSTFRGIPILAAREALDLIAAAAR